MCAGLSIFGGKTAVMFHIVNSPSCASSPPTINMICLHDESDDESEVTIYRLHMKTHMHFLVLCINDYYANFAYMPLEIHFMMHVHLLNPLRPGGHLVVASKGVKCACSCVQ